MSVFTPSLSAMQIFEYTLRTSYSETDQMGFIHHSNYLKYLENARWDAFRQLLIPYREVEQNGILMPVIHMDINFIRPLRYDEQIKIELWMELKRPTKLDIHYSIYNEMNEVTSKACSTLTFLKMDTGKPCIVPQFLNEKIAACCL